MNQNNVLVALQEAERFCKKAKALISEIRSIESRGLAYYGGAASASVKRSSLDLTKALAKMRVEE